ncbi:DUF4062 domain-containing protein [Rhodococcoides fascians]|uniref:DUF4062 domain-containing protein n=1 Tax=Rhodococcoides fascians TaxID=1828 RepID=UPI0018AF9A65|nr:DUF4062 domain-containing protein [Rhodococcus fascians]
MEKRYQVFVSSTYEDLQEERREVIQALLELECLPAGMELFPAASEDQWTLIKEVIDQSDYYVVVVGGKYGSLSDEGISYTEREFDYAVSKDMQILGFVPEDTNEIPKGKIELDPNIRIKLEAFQAKVMAKHIKKYKSKEDLGAVVSRALNIAMRRHPREGWVRGRFAMSQETQTEIAQLREALAEAEVEKLKDARGDSDTSGFSQGDDQFTADFSVSYYGEKYKRQSFDAVATLTWNEVLREIGTKMLDEASDTGILNRLEAHLQVNAKLGEGQRERLRAIENPTITLYLNVWERIVVQLRAIEWIDKGIKRRPVSDTHTYFRLTEKGERQLVRLLAETRELPASNGGVAAEKSKF